VRLMYSVFWFEIVYLCNVCWLLVAFRSLLSLLTCDSHPLTASRKTQ
jgi:hypothetical protein